MSAKPLTVVLDGSVICHALHHNLKEAQIEPAHYQGWLKAQIAWVISGHWLGSLLREDTRIIVVADSKPYWRVDYLLDPVVVARIDRPKAGKKHMKRFREIRELMASDAWEGIYTDDKKVIRSEYKELLGKLQVHYKAGRKLPEASFTKLKGHFYDVLGDLGVQVLRATGYEADDLAAAIVAVNRGLDTPNDILLATVDSDWLGLLGLDVTWFCTHGWFPRVRGWDGGLLEVATKFWARKRLKVDLENPWHLWETKALYGDKSDNLPPNSPLEVIDLLEPPFEHRLWEKPAYRSVIRNFLIEPYKAPLWRSDSIDRAQVYLRSLGARKVIRPLDPDKDYYYEGSGYE